jgi:hypothetical protein
MRRIPSLFDAPDAWGWTVGLTGAAVFLIFAFLGQAERGKIAAFSAVALLGFVGMSWQYRAYIWFLILSATFIFAHLAFIFLNEFSTLSGPTLLIYGSMFIVDTLVMVAIAKGIATLLRN